MAPLPLLLLPTSAKVDGEVSVVSAAISEAAAAEVTSRPLLVTDTSSLLLLQSALIVILCGKMMQEKRKRKKIVRFSENQSKNNYIMSVFHHTNARKVMLSRHRRTFYFITQHTVVTHTHTLLATFFLTPTKKEKQINKVALTAASHVNNLVCEQPFSHFSLLSLINQLATRKHEYSVCVSVAISLYSHTQLTNNTFSFFSLCACNFHFSCLSPSLPHQQQRQHQ